MSVFVNDRSSPHCSISINGCGSTTRCPKSPRVLTSCIKIAFGKRYWVVNEQPPGLLEDVPKLLISQDYFDLFLPDQPHVWTILAKSSHETYEIDESERSHIKALIG